jgi:hypothetical protein
MHHKWLKNLKFLLLLITIFSTACSIAPLHGPYSARTIDKNKSEFVAGSSFKFERPFLRYGTSISENLDVGLLTEWQFGLLLGAWAKFALINQKEGFSLAVDGGVGGAGKSTYYSIGPIASYKYGFWETGLSLKYNYINWGDQDVSLGDIGSIDVGNSNFNYLYTTFSNAFWFSKEYALLFQISNIKGLGNLQEEGSFSDNLIYTFAIVMRH